MKAMQTPVNYLVPVKKCIPKRDRAKTNCIDQLVFIGIVYINRGYSNVWSEYDFYFIE